MVLDGRIHPSLGSPGDTVVYVPCPLYEHDGGQSSTELEDGPTLSVCVPGADIPNIFAHRQWRAGMLLADMLYARIIDVREKLVLELGAGTGLPSIVASRFAGADLVVCTDYDSPSLISTLRQNVLRNVTNPNSVRIAGHTWAQAIDDVEDLIPGRRSKFDAILLADCIWDDLSHADLLRSISRLLERSEDGRIYMVSGLHTGRQKIVSFLRRARKLGLHLCEFPSPTQGWPVLSEEETQVAQKEESLYINDDLLRDASRMVVEMQIANRTADEERGEAVQDHILYRSANPRLTGRRRAFIIEERAEENREAAGIHERNRWITFFSLRWQM